ncbi:hypothetical protein SAY87_031094 [Trapa incisa]|uniref:Uncharacterized protein n=1 Tax=Trapa incisa TaxID=236973 RepID=A0AAN7KP93_9MYRT|nr:hypothetical protein SAY87_031094 [Trapa incisa]
MDIVRMNSPSGKDVVETFRQRLLDAKKQAESIAVIAQKLLRRHSCRAVQSKCWSLAPANKKAKRQYELHWCKEREGGMDLGLQSGMSADRWASLTQLLVIPPSTGDRLWS